MEFRLANVHVFKYAPIQHGGRDIAALQLFLSFMQDVKNDSFSAGKAVSGVRDHFKESARVV